jgi:hypothetical protein
LCDIQTLEDDEMRGTSHLLMNVDRNCSVPKALETRVQSQSYALNESQSSSQLERDLSYIICNQSNNLETRIDPGNHRDNVRSASRAIDFKEIVSQFSESNQGNSLYYLCS